MGNKAERVKEQVQQQETLEMDFLDNLGEIGIEATPEKQGKYIKAVLDEVKSRHGAEACRKIMRPCGYQCISESAIATAKSLYQKTNQDMTLFLELMNNNHIGGGHLLMEDDSIIGSYDTCYCGIPKQVKGLPKEYCECSAGWFERLFSEVFERNVDVKIIQTFLSGGDKCIFKISY